MSTLLLVWCCGKIFSAHFGLHHHWTPQLTWVLLLQDNTEGVHSTVTGLSPTAALGLNGRFSSWMLCDDVILSTWSKSAENCFQHQYQQSVPNKVAVSVYRYSSGGQKWKHKPWMTEGVVGGALWLHHWCGRVTPVDKRWSLHFTASAFRLQERKEAGGSVHASLVICTDTAAPHRYTEYNQCSGTSNQNPQMYSRIFCY